MRLDRLEIFTFPVPFRTVFRHASAARSRAENIVVRVRDASGLAGYGEGCPRSYVTGETVAGAAQFIRDRRAAIVAEIDGIDALRRWIDANRAAIDRNPAAFCAVELALLDLFGKAENAPVEDIAGLPRLSGAFAYSAILGDSPFPVFWWQFRRYRRAGFSDFKMKASPHAARDRRKLRLFRRHIGGPVALRVDGNNLWQTAEHCVDHLRALSWPFTAVEEPLQPGDFSGFRAVGEALGTPIVLDESLARPEQVEGLADPERWLVNLRISKMGGILRSAALAEKAAARGLRLVIGAQVGETSLLTRAALAVANAYRPNLAAMEGAFGTMLLRRDLTDPCLMFGAGGQLAPDGLIDRSAPGLGLAVDDTALVPLPG